MSRRERVAVVLAAGKGTRMASDLPKVLHLAAGQPLLTWVLQAARAAGFRRIFVVVGHGAPAVQLAFPRAENPDLAWVLQSEQRGTGHALAQAEPKLLGREATVVVLSGDVPLVTPETLRELARLAEEPGAWGAMAVAEILEPAEPGSLGRVVATPEGHLQKIVEAKDATPEERAIRLVNAGLYALPAPAVFDYLRRLTPDNAQRELYLTDAPTLAAADGHIIRLLKLADPEESLGVNTPAELAQVDQRLLARQRSAVSG